MKQPFPLEAPAQTALVLSISPVEDDHITLRRILNRAEASQSAIPAWKLQPSRGLGSALTAIRQKQFSIIISERDLSPGTWKQVLAVINELQNPPLLIVTSRLADERLWSEVLNLGGWDVLAKPFSVKEVRWVVNMAWSHWQQKAISSQGQASLKMAAG